MNFGFRMNGILEGFELVLGRLEKYVPFSNRCMIFRFLNVEINMSKNRLLKGRKLFTSLCPRWSKIFRLNPSIGRACHPEKFRKVVLAPDLIATYLG